jgi:hypothetical protein
MFSVSRFLLRGGKLSFRTLKSLNSEFIKMKVNNFGAKAKDPDSVDKSKKSISGGGATASDSEKREPTQQTIKVAKQTTSEKTLEKTSESSNETSSSTAPAQTAQIKIIQSIPGNRVSFRFYFSLQQVKKLYLEDMLIHFSWLLVRKKISTMFMRI